MSNMRQRVRAASANASLHFRKPQADELTFWCGSELLASLYLWL